MVPYESFAKMYTLCTCFVGYSTPFYLLFGITIERIALGKLPYTEIYHRVFNKGGHTLHVVRMFALVAASREFKGYPHIFA